MKVYEVNPFKPYIETLESAHMEDEFQKYQDQFNSHGRIIILGNGGSNSVASHISQDYMKFHKKKVSVFSGFSPHNTMRRNAHVTSKYSKWDYHVDSDSYGVIECVHQIFLHGVV